MATTTAEAVTRAFIRLREMEEHRRRLSSSIATHLNEVAVIAIAEDAAIREELAARDQLTAALRDHQAATDAREADARARLAARARATA